MYTTVIPRVYQGIGEDPIITDLDSSPWKDNPGLLASARKRTSGLEWKWRKVINEATIAEGREANNLPAQPFGKKYREQEKQYRLSRKQGGKKKSGDEEESEDNEE